KLFYLLMCFFVHKNLLVLLFPFVNEFYTISFIRFYLFVIISRSNSIFSFHDFGFIFIKFLQSDSFIIFYIYNRNVYFIFSFCFFEFKSKLIIICLCKDNQPWYAIVFPRSVIHWYRGSVPHFPFSSS